MRTVVTLAVRYLVLLALGVLNLRLFYLIFTPLTVHPVFWLLSIIDTTTRLFAGNIIFFSGLYAEIIPACVAGAAYYLLLILNLTTPMDTKTRTKSIFFLLGTFLLLNIARILVFAALLASGQEYFDAAHNLVWYFGSTVFVVVVWFANVLLFRIGAVPIYSDIKEIFKDVASEKSKTREKSKRL